jgi:hypothetical protein
VPVITSCPVCRSPRTAVTIDIPTGDRDRMCASCGHHWYPAELHPLMAECCARFIQSRPRPTRDGSMLRCPDCHRDLVLRGRWHIHTPSTSAPDGPPLPDSSPGAGSAPPAAESA